MRKGNGTLLQSKKKINENEYVYTTNDLQYKLHKEYHLDRKMTQIRSCLTKNQIPFIKKRGKTTRYCNFYKKDAVDQLYKLLIMTKYQMYKLAPEYKGLIYDKEIAKRFNICLYQVREYLAQQQFECVRKFGTIKYYSLKDIDDVFSKGKKNGEFNRISRKTKENPKKPHPKLNFYHVEYNGYCFILYKGFRTLNLSERIATKAFKANNLITLLKEVTTYAKQKNYKSIREIQILSIQSNNESLKFGMAIFE